MAVAAQAPRTSETARLVTTIDFIDLRLGWSKGSSSPVGIALRLLAMVVSCATPNFARFVCGATVGLSAHRSKTVRALWWSLAPPELQPL